MAASKLTFGMIADPIDSFHPEAETSFFILHEIARRGHEAYIMELADLYLDQGEVTAQAAKVRVAFERGRFTYRLGKQRTLRLRTVDCLMLRKDPPVDEQYLNHLTLLEVLEAKGGKRPFMVNSPAGIKKANEKIYPLHFEGISPPTLVSRKKAVLLTFVRKHRKVVLKPLNSSGGRGIFILTPSTPDLMAVLEDSTREYAEYVMLQKYLPAAKKGDKRILLLNGEPLGSFLRVPHPDDFRGNMHQGAKWVRSRIEKSERAIIRRIKPALLGDGLYFVGLDLIGGKITEINSTSPMGIREINALEGIHCERIFVDWLEKSLRSRPPNK